jgi:hypothetical protein
MKKPQTIPGKPQALSETVLGRPVSIEAFLKRYLLLNAEGCEGAPVHIAAHLIKDLKEPPAPYVDAHRHPDCDEIGLVIGQPGALEYEIILDGKVHHLLSPASIFIPAGTVHRARALRGNGAYVCILMDPGGPRPSNSSKAGA